MKAFVHDAVTCVGCYCCQIACKDEHCSNDWTPIAKPQPLIGQFWMNLILTERGATPQVRVAYTAMPCQHCEDAPCAAACPIDGAIYTRPDGLVIIDPVKCTGCKNCVDACPYGAIYFNTALYIAQKCTGCAHLLDDGWKEPRCVDQCATRALRFGEESELDLTGAETLHPEFGLTTRVHYKNLPKKFIAGCAYDPVAKEIVEGATCTLTGEGDTFTLATDEWGDFWFENLKDNGMYSLTIESNGKSYTKSDISTEKDVGLGDLALS